MYGRSGESERLIAKALGATSAGDGDRHEVRAALDARQPPDARRAARHPCGRECEESLQRLETDRVDLLYLHAPDKTVPVAESAGELKRLLDAGKTRAVGASNLALAQLDEFADECPLAAFQPPYNMLMRGIEADVLPWCRDRGVGRAGLLAADERSSGGQDHARPGLRSERQPEQVPDVPGRGAA